MKILRIKDVKINNSSNIDVSFTENLVPNLTIANINIIADTINVPDAEVLAIQINKNILSINCQPLTPEATYILTLKSTDTNPFISLHNTAKIVENNNLNTFIFIGPQDADNPIKNYLEAFFRNNIYNIDDTNTIINKYLRSLSNNLSKALYDIRQTKNDNYLSFNVIDEKKIRGTGAFDRLLEENAYQLIRAGITPTGTNVDNTFIISEFPSYPITLQKQTNIETLTSSSVNEVGKFNINNLICNLSKSPITKINSITFILNTVIAIYEYNIETLGYQIKNSRYDQDFSFTYLILEDNQIKLNDKILSDNNFDLNHIIRIDISYEYKDLGIVIDNTSVNTYTILNSGRETLPPIVNVFSLKHSPIVDTNNSVPLLAGITFIDPNSNTGSLHPAFINEIPFRLNALPNNPGQYSIDYPNATIYVFGSDTSNDGTGAFPPLAIYNYRFVYKLQLDYVYDADLLDLVALPTGNLINNQGNINFNYEKVLTPNIDFVANLHTEVLEERINNNLVALNALRTINSSINTVFRIYNETSGEIYTIDRWADNKVYFKYNNAPRIISQINERASFQNINSELLFVDSSSINFNSLNIFKIFLNNDKIISSTEDSIASSFNTSLVLSDANIFIKEKWFNSSLEINDNLNRLENIGEYITDYVNGIIYVAVIDITNFDIGTATYKSDIIVPTNPHIISVDDIYYRISIFAPKNKQFTYDTFQDGEIIPDGLEISDEKYLNNDISVPYQLFQETVGTFIDAVFIENVSNQVKFVRNIFEYTDLLNSTNPLNFGTTSTSVDFTITVSSINRELFDTIKFDGTNFYVNINENIPYISSNITYNFSVIRVSDNQELWDNNGIMVAGNPVKLKLSGIGAPTTDELVHIIYTFTINDLSRIVIDYNKGDLFIDYIYLADEILISYEYGDNTLDFRTGKTLSPGDIYYASYKVGALRNALSNNFASLINIPELLNIDIDINRERYRDALMAALTSFIKGPTVPAIKNIGQTISHIEPIIQEGAFQNWSLGNSLLTPDEIHTTGSFELLPAKYNNGVLVNSSDQTISIPVSSNLRLEEGTFETWVLPQWDGLDNDADLIFNILKDGYSIDAFKIFLGSGETHPTFNSDGTFSINKNYLNISGTPNMNKDGVYIYYDKDISGNFNRWYVEIVDGYVETDGYVDGYTNGIYDGYASDYKFTITTNGKFYDNKVLNSLPSNMKIITSNSKIIINITGGLQIIEGITFLADLEHYILDFGKNETQSRFSLFKDTSGYINFRVYDQDKVVYIVSANVSDWKKSELHHIAISWKLNTRNNRDEMHLFIDGFETSNIIKYSQKVHPYLHQKFRTVSQEDIAGLSTRDIIGSIDLTTTLGSNIVSSSVNFSAYNIFIGDIIYIDEPEFASSGYTITNVNGQQLTLNLTMPATITNGKYSVNRSSFTVSSDIDIAPNIAIYTIQPILSGIDLTTTFGLTTISSTSTNFETFNIEPGYSISIDGSSLELLYTIVAVSGNTLTITDALPSSGSNLTYRIYDNTEQELSGIRATRPDYSISKNYLFNNILTISNNVLKGDLILVRTLGLNHKDIKKRYYVWSDNVENVLMTRMPPPISLDEAKFIKVLLPIITIGPNNSTLSSGIFTSNDLTTSQPTLSVEGRQIFIMISGTNVDFSTSTQIIIDGIANGNHIAEILIFTDFGSKTSINHFNYINYIRVITKPINSNKVALAIEAKEAKSITLADGYADGYVDGYTTPIVNYSYQIGANTTLKKDTDSSVRDENNIFSGLDTNNYLQIFSPVSVAGFYKIISVSSDLHSLNILPTNAPDLPLSSFTNGKYQILNTTQYRSGLQNGFFTFEQLLSPGEPYYLNSGTYEVQYSTYARIKFDPLSNNLYLGSDFNGTKQINSILDQVKIYNVMLSDVRAGETQLDNQNSITKDFNSLKALKSDTTTLALINFDTFPFSNSASFYSNTNTLKEHFSSSEMINENFNNSLVILDKPIILDNEGILDTKKQGTIEFWMNPIYDTANDPNIRYYFDAFGAVLEEAISINDASIKISSPANQILNVKLKVGDQTIDYFSGGKLEIDTQNAIQEEGFSINSTSVLVSKPILQVISVKIENDYTNIDYFADGSISTDLQTIYLGKELPSNNLPLIITYQTTENKKVKQNSQVIRLNRKLPYQNTKVIVSYIPKGLQGDRISIFKDIYGYMNFEIDASGLNYILRAPTRWAQKTWHRVKASYKVNSGAANDEMRLFLDGYEFSNILYGTGYTYGSDFINYGSTMPGDGYTITGNIKFKDPINELFIGTDYTQNYPIFSLIDNFRISNISRPIYAPFGEPLDVNYSTNLDTVFPVTSDLYTTYLLDFDQDIELIDDFAILRNRMTGLFDFSINILNSLDIIDNDKIKSILEALLKTLKPANSKIFIEYT